jgi:hypothetical protein
MAMTRGLGLRSVMTGFRVADGIAASGECGSQLTW